MNDWHVPETNLHSLEASKTTNQSTHLYVNFKHKYPPTPSLTLFQAFQPLEIYRKGEDSPHVTESWPPPQHPSTQSPPCCCQLIIMASRKYGGKFKCLTRVIYIFLCKSLFIFMGRDRWKDQRPNSSAYIFKRKKLHI